MAQRVSWWGDFYRNWASLKIWPGSAGCVSRFVLATTAILRAGNSPLAGLLQKKH